MKNNVTTTKNGFRIEDITFHNARRQSEIVGELDLEEEIENSIDVPVSITPEQVKGFYQKKISLVNDSNEKRLYSQTIQWIDELFDLKKKVLNLEEKLAILTVPEEKLDIE